METKIQIKNIYGEVLFEYEKENNTIKDTVEEAVKQNRNLHKANLQGANLCGINLGGAYLQEANLIGANLCYAAFRYAELCYTDFRCANLCYADFSHVNLSNADFSIANLSRARFYKANLYEADFYEANLSYVYFGKAECIHYIPLNCPSEGAFIAWKKVKRKLVQLEIPEDAKRSSATSMKCRCDKAKVLAITDLDGSNPIDEIWNRAQESELLYKVGEMVYPDSFDEDRWNECSHGIHFFINKQDAINY